MANKKLFLVLIAVLGIAAISLNFILKVANLPNRAQNGFIRTQLLNIDEPQKTLSSNGLVTRISGFYHNKVFLSGKDPQWILKSDFKFDVIDTIVFGINETESLRDPGIVVDYPNVYMYARDISYLLTGTVHKPMLDTLKLKTFLITRSAQISRNRLAVRSIDSSQTRQVFSIVDCQSGDVVVQKTIIENQQFGGFNVDGEFKYDKTSGNLFYVQMFSNELICMDTMLNIIYKGRTIDTTFVNKVNIDLVTEDGSTKVMSTAPRQVVNKFMDIKDGFIFINSGLRADNQKLLDFNKRFVFDIYKSENAKYVGSIFVKKHENVKMSDFKVHDGRLFLVYDNGVCAVYELNMKQWIK